MSVWSKIQGIYDLKTLELARSFKVEKFAFDLNPRSLYFVTIDDLKIFFKTRRKGEQLSLVFPADQLSILKSYKTLLPEFQSFGIDLNGGVDLRFLEEANLPFTLTLVNHQDMKKYYEHPLCLGVQIRLDAYAEKQLRNLSGYAGKVALVGLEKDFEKVSLSSLLKDLPRVLTLSSEIESSYRNINDESFKLILGRNVDEENSTLQ